MTAKHSWPQIKRYYPLSTNPQVTNVQPSPRTLKIPEICLHPTAWEIESWHAWSDQISEKGSSVLKQHIKKVVSFSYAVNESHCDFYIVTEKQLSSKNKHFNFTNPNISDPK